LAQVAEQTFAGRWRSDRNELEQMAAREAAHGAAETGRDDNFVAKTAGDEG
jgi:hypothetical protein